MQYRVRSFKKLFPNAGHLLFPQVEYFTFRRIVFSPVRIRSE